MAAFRPTVLDQTYRHVSKVPIPAVTGAASSIAADRVASYLYSMIRRSASLILQGWLDARRPFEDYDPEP